MALAFEHEVHSLAWTVKQPNCHFARGILSYIWNQIENGAGCPAGMTYAAYLGLAQPECGLAMTMAMRAGYATSWLTRCKRASF
jgi:putative acyl-CoA dehydrogenase